MQVRADGMTDVGLSRVNNEDSFGIYPERSLFIVADGVGGQPAGEVASRFVTDRLPQAVEDLAAEAENDSPRTLERAIRRINAQLLETATQKVSWRGMSTTVVAAWFRSGEIVIANVGDSRAYLVRGQEIAQISEDHTVLAEQQREGLAEAESAGRTAHILTRCLGIEKDIKVYTDSFPVQDGDRLLLCSDGLSDSLSPEVVRSIILSASTPGEGCRMLIDLANRNSGHDNITALLIFFDEAKLKAGLAKMMGRRN